ncbi:hypothetical protein PLESTF_000281400 [Pleodorina starrii]|nr:hypothetical protein PLESTF_000281400 [Pleodorina starrii]
MALGLLRHADVPNLPAETPKTSTSTSFHRDQEAALQPAEQPSQEAAPEQLPLQASAEQPATNEQPTVAQLKVIYEEEARSPGPYLDSVQTCAVDVQMDSVEESVEAGSCDLRSLRQLEREVEEAVPKEEGKAEPSELCSPVVRSPKITERQLPVPDNNDDDLSDDGDDLSDEDDDDDLSDDHEEYEDQENDLVAAMSGLKVATPKTNAPVPLRGLPVPQGQHIRFHDDDAASESPKRTVLRGLPVATGTHKRFD